MSDLWLMVGLVVALLVGNLWLLKRNSKQQLRRDKERKSRSAAIKESMTDTSAAAPTQDEGSDRPRDN